MAYQNSGYAADLNTLFNQTRETQIQASNQVIENELKSLFTKPTYLRDDHTSVLSDYERSIYQLQDGNTQDLIESIIWDTICKNATVPRNQSEEFKVVTAALNMPMTEAPSANDLASVYSKPQYVAAYDTTVFTDLEGQYYRAQSAATQIAIQSIIWQSIAARGEDTRSSHAEHNHAVTTLQTDPASLILTTPQRSLTDPAVYGNNPYPQNMLAPAPSNGDQGNSTALVRSWTLPSHPNNPNAGFDYGTNPPR